MKIRVISGKSHGVESPVRPLGGCWYFHFIFKKSGKVFQELRELPALQLLVVRISRFSAAAGWTAFIYSWKGSLRVGSDETMYEPFYTFVLSAEPGQNGVELTATEGTEFVLVGTLSFICLAEILTIRLTTFRRLPSLSINRLSNMAHSL